MAGRVWLLAPALLTAVLPSRAEAQLSRSHASLGGLPALVADHAPEPILVELRLGHLAARTVTAFRMGAQALLPLSQFLELAEVEHAVSPDGVIRGVVQPQGLQFAIDTRRNRATIGERRLSLADAPRVERDGETYLGARAIGDLLGLEFVVRWAELMVLLPDPGPLPVARRARREAALARLLADRAEEDVAPLGAPLDRPFLDGFVMDYGLHLPSTEALDRRTYATAIGVDLLGGSLTAEASGQFADPRFAPRLAWTGVWRDNPRVRQVRVGDGSSVSPAYRPIRGITVTNAPYLRSARFARVPYAGQAGPGWEVQTYRDGRLVAVDSADELGRYVVQLPLDYGNNLAEFVAYGPHGESQRVQRFYPVDAELLPARQFEYGIAGGWCGDDACAALASVDARYGLSDGWTVRGGADALARPRFGAPSWQPYGSLAGGGLAGWNVLVEGRAGAAFRGVFRYEPSPRLALASEYARFPSDVDALSPGPSGARALLAFSGRLRPRGYAGRWALSGDAQDLDGGTGRATSAQLGLDAFHSQGVSTPYVRVERRALAGMTERRSAVVGLRTVLFPAGALARLGRGDFVDGLSLRGAVEARGSRLVSRSAFLFARVAQRVNVQLGVSWREGARGPALTLVALRDFAAVRARTSLTGQQGGGVATSQDLQGSLLWNARAGRLVASAGPSLQRAGLAGRLFLDNNGNGRRDDGEPPVVGVRVRVGFSVATSDSTGAFEVHDVIPFEPVPVQVDSGGMPSPLWVPSQARMSVRLAPNRFLPLDIPIVPAGVVDGRVVREVQGAPEGVAGVPVVLTDLRSGASRRVSTFSDGEFLFEAVAPGEYELWADPATLARVRMEGTRRRIVVRAMEQGDEVSGVEIIVAPMR